MSSASKKLTVVINDPTPDELRVIIKILAEDLGKNAAAIATIATFTTTVSTQSTPVPVQPAPAQPAPAQPAVAQPIPPIPAQAQPAAVQHREFENAKACIEHVMLESEAEKNIAILRTTYERNPTLQNEVVARYFDERLFYANLIFGRIPTWWSLIAMFREGTAMRKALIIAGSCGHAESVKCVGNGCIGEERPITLIMLTFDSGEYQELSGLLGNEYYKLDSATRRVMIAAAPELFQTGSLDPKHDLKLQELYTTYSHTVDVFKNDTKALTFNLDAFVETHKPMLDALFFYIRRLYYAAFLNIYRDCDAMRMVSNDKKVAIHKIYMDLRLLKKYAQEARVLGSGSWV